MLKRQKLAALDRARRSTAVKNLAAVLSLPLGFAGPARTRLRALDRFLRFNPESPLAGYAYRQALALARDVGVGPGVPVLDRTVVLKAPGPGGERGYLLTSFESELGKLARSARLAEVQGVYDILFLPTWQPFYSPVLYQFVARATRPLFLMPSSNRDYELCRKAHPEIVALPFQASSWVKPEGYTDRGPAGKDIDIVVLANFSPYKRHWLLFRALRDLPRRIRVALVGVPFRGRTKDDLLREARLFGTDDRVEVYQSTPDATVADILSRSKVCLALSAKEGSYIGVAEALFSNTPVGLYRDAVIGSKDYINAQTGTLFDPRQPLAGQILQFLESAASYRPAEWARANISSAVNGAKLNALLRSRAETEGSPWTRDIEPFHCRHFRFLYDDPGAEARFRGAYDDLRDRLGVEVDRS